jgi:hypothetical protein
MNLLDENVPASQHDLLRKRRVRFRQIGLDLGRLGMKDEEIIPLLHQLDRPTFFTLDGDFYDRRLCHEGYCLAHLAVEEDLVAEYVLRFLRHRELNTKAKRMGLVIRGLLSGFVYWRLHEDQEHRRSWQ